jgi:thioredoxin
MKQIILSLLFIIGVTISGCTETSNKTTNDSTDSQKSTEVGKVIQMDKAMFIEKVFNYEANPEKWTYLGDKPCIIDFYADWCGPCKKVAPIMSEFAEEYNGEIVVYKVDTDQQKELAQVFGIRSIPSVLFCPTEGQPTMTMGALPKAEFQKIINDVLLKKAETSTTQEIK